MGLRMMKNEREELDKENQNMVYHYCKLDTFLKIIQNKTIRLSDVEKSNDYTERVFFENKVHEKLVEVIKQNWPEELVKKMLKIEELCRKEINTSNVLYAACFSEEKDMLSQWRGYADDGAGVSIGFSKEILSAVNDVEYGLTFRKICYDEKKQEKFVRDYVGVILQTMNKKNLFASFAEVYENRIEEIGCMKSPGFVEEKEWRLCKAMTPELRIDREGTFKDFGISKVHEQCIRNQIVTYIDLSFEKIFNSVIGEVVIGPKAKVSEVDIRRSLYMNGFTENKIKISKASVTYR